MPTCASCSSELRPEWKYCVRCGTPVIPAAIRPDAIERPSRIDRRAVIVLGGTLLGVVALLFIVDFVLRVL